MCPDSSGRATVRLRSRFGASPDTQEGLENPRPRHYEARIPLVLEIYIYFAECVENGVRMRLLQSLDDRSQRLVV